VRRYELRPFGPDAPPVAAVLAGLHAELLPTSPIVALGRRFAEGFYYDVLPRRGCMFGAVAYVDGEPAGFVSATHDSDGFVREGAWQRPVKLAWSLFASMLTEPGFVQGMREAVAISATRAEVETAGEILSLGVRPAYRALGFVRSTGIQVAHDLLRCALDGLRERNVSKVKAIVDADNLAVQLLLSGSGWSLARDRVPGWRVPSFEFVLATGR
jgi:ribosomal protein S18 acetylase RimI-like enzyme